MRRADDRYYLRLIRSLPGGETASTDLSVTFAPRGAACSEAERSQREFDVDAEAVTVAAIRRHLYDCLRLSLSHERLYCDIRHSPGCAV